MTVLALKRLVVYWLSSYAFANAVYGLLWLVMPHHQVFAGLPRMFMYHTQHPLQYIAIPCFFFAPLATLASDAFYRGRRGKRINITLGVIFGTVTFSAPFGGMLWHYHDFEAGYFPENWFQRMADGGVGSLLEGWLVVLLSVPYNLIGGFVAYQVLKWISRAFPPAALPPAPTTDSGS